MESVEEKFLFEFLTAIDGWESKVIIGGGFALIIYRSYFSQKDRVPVPVGTRDLDTLIP